MQIFLVTYLTFLIFCGNLYAQSIKKNYPDKEKYKSAEKFLGIGNYQKALDIYKTLLTKDTLNANLNYKVGLCLMKLPLKKTEAIPYFYKALLNIAEENKYVSDSSENKQAPFETPLVLTEAYILNNEFDKSLDFLNDFQSLISVDNDNLKKYYTRLKDQCNFGKEMTTASSNLRTTVLETPVNSVSDDFNPMISSDESVMIFASRRNNSKTKNNENPANIYISRKKENKWGAPEKMSALINDPGDNIPAGLSADGKQLFICKKENRNSDLYQSIFNEKTWSQLTKISTKINSNFDETNAAISSDGNILYFTSNRAGGFGGFDIYISKKLPNGEWGEAQNMGPIINTEYDEACPYLHPDGFTFFFASKGHLTMGGFDIFFCSANDDFSWGESINLGYPVNTTEDDLYYTPIADGKKAYYASYNSDGIGGSDIFQISAINSSKPQAIAYAYVKPENISDAENIDIALTDNETKEIIGRYTPNPKTGKFLVVLTPRKNHIIYCASPGYFPYINSLILSRKSSYQETATALSLDTIYLNKKYQTYSFEFLDIDTAVSPKAETRLEITADYLKSASAIIEIIGNHHNLADNRVKYLKNYLIKTGIPEYRIQLNFTAPDNNDTIDLVIFNIQNEKIINDIFIKKNYIRKLK